MDQGRRPPSAAAEAMAGRDGAMPLVALLDALLSWCEDRHLELVAAAGFDDVRRAHNTVFAHVPGDGIRLTELAWRAGISKQAMGELVTDLEAKGYFRRVPDPEDGRAKLIVWADRGMAAHEATVRAFARLERELAASVGDDRLEDLRATMTSLFGRLVVGAPPGGSPRGT